MPAIYLDDVPLVLECLRCSVVEFREIAHLLIEDFSIVMQNGVFDLLSSHDEKQRQQAVYCICSQKTWVLSENIIQEMLHISLNDDNSLTRMYAIFALPKIGVAHDDLIVTLKKFFRDFLADREYNQFVVTNLIELSSKYDSEGLLTDQIVLFFQQKYYGSEFFVAEYLRKRGRWTPLVKDYINQILANGVFINSTWVSQYGENGFDEQIVRILSRIDAPHTDKTSILKLIISRTTDTTFLLKISRTLEKLELLKYLISDITKALELLSVKHNGAEKTEDKS